jgi:hypothetical protein
VARKQIQRIEFDFVEVDIDTLVSVCRVLDGQQDTIALRVIEEIMRGIF